MSTRRYKAWLAGQQTAAGLPDGRNIHPSPDQEIIMNEQNNPAPVPAPLAALRAYNARHANEAITAIDAPVALTVALADADRAREAYEAAGYHGTDEYLDVLERLAEAVRAELA